MTGRDKPSPHHTRQGVLVSRISNASLGLTLLAVLAIGGFLVSRVLPPTSGAKPTSSPTPAASSEASPDQTAPLTPAPTTTPSTGLVGVYPEPNATLPPGAPPVIPGLRVEALASAAEAEGMTCTSEAGTYQEAGRGYTLACDGQDPGGHAKFGLSVTYWTLDSVSEIYLSAWSDKAGAVVSSAAPIKILSSISDLSGGEIAKTWVLGHLDDKACSPNCIRTSGSVRIEFQVGVDGGRALHVLATAG